MKKEPQKPEVQQEKDSKDSLIAMRRKIILSDPFYNCSTGKDTKKGFVISVQNYKKSKSHDTKETKAGEKLKQSYKDSHKLAAEESAAKKE